MFIVNVTVQRVVHLGGYPSRHFTLQCQPVHLRSPPSHYHQLSPTLTNSHRSLLPRFRYHRDFHPLPITNHHHVHRLADLHGVQRIGVIVDVLDLLAAELDDDVAAFQTSLLRRTAAAHAAEFDPFDFDRVVGNRADIDAKLLAGAAGGTALCHLQVIRPLRGGQEIGNDRLRELRNLLHASVVNFFGFFGWGGGYSLA